MVVVLSLLIATPVILLFQNCQGELVAIDMTRQVVGENLAATSVPILTANNVYSPSLVEDRGQMYMFFGGWYEAGQQQDSIYRAHCPQPLGPCTDVIKVVDPVALGYEHLNDPSLVKLPDGTFIMYVTGVKAGKDGFVTTNNQTYFLTSTDLLQWTAPVLIAADLWMPAVTRSGSGSIYLWGNRNTDGRLFLLNLGETGRQIVSKTDLLLNGNLPEVYVNVEAIYRPELKRFQIFAETLTASTSPNKIDHLESYDGRTWTVVDRALVRPRDGQLYVRTPAAHPTLKNILYYAETNDPKSMANQLRSREFFYRSPSLPPVDGSCGDQINACKTGTLLDIADSSTEYRWQCRGYNGGTSSPVCALSVGQLVSAEAKAQIAGWPASYAIDNQADTVYSSPVSDPLNSQGHYLAAWFPTQQRVGRLYLRARMSGSRPLGFPQVYRVFLTNPQNTAWLEIGVFSNQPDVTGQVDILLKSEKVSSFGVLIVPQKLGADDYGNYYFQLADVQLR